MLLCRELNYYTVFELDKDNGEFGTLADAAIACVADWGKILDAGFDCCPECFNEKNDFESPYKAPEINSACHAWSCTPAYWIYKFIKEEK